jgi:WD40 repeat protein
MRGAKTELLVWDRESGKVKHTVPYTDGVRSAAFSPDGKILATASYDGMVRFHDADTMKVWAVSEPNVGAQGRQLGINGLCFLQDGKYLATAGLQARNVSIWDVEAVRARRAGDQPVTFPPVAVLEGHEQRVLSVAASADGKTIISGSGDQTARLWDLPESLPKMGEKPLVIKKERAILRGHQSEVEAVAASPDGTLFATAAWDNQVFTWDRDGRRAELTGTFRAPGLCLAFSKDGKYLAAGAGNFNGGGQPGEVRVWDVTEKKELAYRMDYPEAVFGVAFTPDAKSVASVGDDRAMHLWEFPDPKAERVLRPEGLVYDAQPLSAVAVSPDEHLLAFAGESKGIYVWNRTESKLVSELTGHGDVVTGLAFSPDGRTLASASHDRTVKLWDTNTWKERKVLAAHTGWVFGLAFSPDGRTLATGSYDKTVKLWDVQTGEPKATWKDHSAGVRTVAFSADGKLLASAGSDRIIRVWDVAEGKVVQLLKGHKAAVRSVAFSPDGKLLASGSEDRSVKLWDTTGWGEIRTLSGLPDMAAAVRFSPKGQTLAVATFQGSVSVYDPLTGRKRQELNAHNEAATGAAFVEDGKFLVTISLDRTVRQWPAVAPGNVAPAQSLSPG